MVMVFRVVLLLILIKLTFSHLAGYGQFVASEIVDITPEVPVAVDGQMHLRITNVIETPLEANILVISKASIFSSEDYVVFVSCDLVTIPLLLRDKIRKDVASKLKGFNYEKIIINATHTHTGAVVRDEWYLIPDSVTQVGDYVDEISLKISNGIIKAWKNLQRGQVSWGINEAKVAFNRRARYADGTARMYGNTSSKEFRGIEGYENQDINSLFVWNKEGVLIGVCINVASPAQIVEGRSTINADYWHPLRIGLREQYGRHLAILGWIDAAGDQTPRPMYGFEAIKRMLRLQNLNSENSRDDYYLKFIAKKIQDSVIETYKIIDKDRYSNFELEHRVESIELPMRIVSWQEKEESRKLRDQDLSSPFDSVKYHRRIVWHQEVLDRYENQKSNQTPQYNMEFNVVQIGDIAVCTNSFELFTEYGIQIKARSPALQTFIIQLAGPGTYIPTQYAVQGGHYSAIVQSNRVGPKGGQILVEETLKVIQDIWAK